jgi:hypothetical protein
MCCRFSTTNDPPFARFGLLTLDSMPTALGSGILFTYPEISTIAGLQGLLVYTLASALPLMAFAFLGPIIRRKCPDGFVLTEWTRERYGVIAAIYLSALTYVLSLDSRWIETDDQTGSLQYSSTW